jgi:hypothetical protein
MRKLLILSLLFPLTVSAECYVRSATLNKSNTPVTRIADIKRHVTPIENNQFRCLVTFRAEINYVWHTAEGMSVGANSDSIDQICSQALDVGRSHILQKVGKSATVSESEMICRDDPIPEVRSTKIGDVVQISELAPHPQKPGFFDYRGAKCRWFVESDVNLQTRDIFQWQGIVCQVRKGDWQVVDKF